MALEYGHLTVFTSSTHPFIPLPQPLPPHHHRRNLVSRAFTTFHHLLYSDFILRRLEQKSAASVLHPFFTSSRHPTHATFSTSTQGTQSMAGPKMAPNQRTMNSKKKATSTASQRTGSRGGTGFVPANNQVPPYYFTYIIPCHRTLLQLFLSPFHTYLKYTAQGH